MVTINNAYFVSFHGTTVVQALQLANADVVSVLATQSDTFKVDVAPVAIVPEAGGYTAVLSYKTVQINVPVTTSLFPQKT